jgi:hypothetical protein
MLSYLYSFLYPGEIEIEYDGRQKHLKYLQCEQIKKSYLLQHKILKKKAICLGHKRTKKVRFEKKKSKNELDNYLPEHKIKELYPTGNKRRKDIKC